MKSPCDVAILGGGPAGAAAARLLAAWGFPVTLLTRPPHHPPLVESLPPSTTRLLEQLGLREAVDRAGFFRSTGNTAWWGATGPRREPFGEGLTGYQVPRSPFDALLLDQAAEAGASVLRHATVRRVSPTRPDGHRTVEFEADGATRSLDALWVLDCTGRAGLTARHGWRKSEPALRTTALVAAWEQRHWPVDDPTHTLVESYGDGWAWSVPESGTRRQVAIMVDPAVTTLAGGAGLADSYREELSRTRHLGPMLLSARMIGEPWARDASSYSVVTAGEPGLLLVGDAASFTDPLSSFGVKKALASAWLAAVVVRSALEDPAIIPPALDFYARREIGVAEALRHRAVDFARQATALHDSEYWARRLADTDPMLPSEPDVAALRSDPAVLAAFQELKRRESPALRVAPGLRRETRPSVHNDRIRLEEQLVLPGFPAGIRWLRGVDLVELVAAAPRSPDVGQLFDACARLTPGIALPDYLGAVSVLLAKGVLEFA